MAVVEDSRDVALFHCSASARKPAARAGSVVVPGVLTAVPSRTRGDESLLLILRRRRREGGALPAHTPYFAGLISSLMSLNRTSIGPPEWIWKAKMPRRGPGGSSRSTHALPLM